LIVEEESMPNFGKMAVIQLNLCRYIKKITRRKHERQWKKFHPKESFGKGRLQNPSKYFSSSCT